jgi:FKBP-type peptidyl-prolyl cis-trans isomerase
MRVSGKRTQIRSLRTLGYGARGAGGDILPSAKLIFDLDLLGAR